MTSLIDVSAAVNALALETISVVRATSEYNDQGVLVVSDEPETLTLRASVQTLVSGRAGGNHPGRNAMQGDNAQRTGGDIAIFTIEELYAPRPESSQQADIVTWRGDEYVVHHVDYWPNGGYCRSTASKRDP